MGEMAKVGESLIKGLWKGISDVRGWLWNKIKGFFDGIVVSIKDFFGIHSPSTLFAGLGANMGEGIAVGFEGAMIQATKDMQSAIPTDFNIKGYSKQEVIPSPSTNIVQNISIVTPKALSEKDIYRELKNLSRKLALEL